MKKRMVTVILVGTLLATGAFSGLALAKPGGGRDCGDRQERMEVKQEKRMEVMAELLDLSDVQQEQISVIHEKERAAMASTREQLQAGREKMRTLVESDNFDEAAIRSLAASQSALKTELMVSRARVKHETFNLLTAEQQEKAEKLEPLLKGKKKHHRPGKGF